MFLLGTTTKRKLQRSSKEWENCISWVTTTKEGVAVVSCWINDLSSKSWRLPFGLRNETSYFKVHKYPFSRHTGWQSKRNCLVVLPSALLLCWMVHSADLTLKKWCNNIITNVDRSGCTITNTIYYLNGLESRLYDF